MEKIKPLYGRDDQTLLLIDSERTLLDAPAPRESEATQLLSPVSRGTSSVARAEQSGGQELPLWGAAPSALRLGQNPLMIAAQEILLFGIELSTIEQDAPMQQLRQRAVQQVKTFEVRGQSLGITRPVAHAARYVICTFLDEMVVTSPWGGAHEWTQESLLSQFHGETYGGQGFFTVLQRACEEPQKNQDLLELQFVILSLGFAGKYRVDPDGHRKLESLRDMIMALVQRARGDQKQSLAVGHALEMTKSRRTRALPWKLLAVAAASCVCALQISLYLLLEQRSQEVALALNNLGTPQVTQPAQPLGSL